MNIKRVIVILSLIILLAAIILLPAFIESIKSTEAEKSISGFDSTDRKKVIAQSCRLNDGACTYHSSLFGRIRIQVIPKDFPAFKPLSVTVDVESHLVIDVVVSLQGEDMFMGPNSTSLINKGPEGWGGNTTIPVCSVDADMVWLVKLTLTGDEREQLVFKVKSTH